MQWKTIGLLSVTGVVMGLLTSLVGLGQLEALVWIAFYAVWVGYVLRKQTPKPFVTILLGSLLSGLWTGLLQAGLMESYLASNPAYVEAMAGQPVWAPIPFALGMGAAFGVLVGGVAVGIKKARS